MTDRKRLANELASELTEALHAALRLAEQLKEVYGVTLECDGGDVSRAEDGLDLLAILHGGAEVLEEEAVDAAGMS